MICTTYKTKCHCFSVWYNNVCNIRQLVKKPIISSTKQLIMTGHNFAPAHDAACWLGNLTMLQCYRRWDYPLLQIFRVIEYVVLRSPPKSSITESPGTFQLRCIRTCPSVSDSVITKLRKPLTEGKFVLIFKISSRFPVETLESCIFKACSTTHREDIDIRLQTL